MRGCKIVLLLQIFYWTWSKDIDFRDVVKRTAVYLHCKWLDGCTTERKQKEWLTWPRYKLGHTISPCFLLKALLLILGQKMRVSIFESKGDFFFFGFKHICLNHQKRRQLLATLVAESRNHFLLLQVNKQKMLVYACLDSNTEPSPRGHGCALVGRSNADKHSWASSMRGVDSGSYPSRQVLGRVLVFRKGPCWIVAYPAMNKKYGTTVFQVTTKTAGTAGLSLFQ